METINSLTEFYLKNLTGPKQQSHLKNVMRNLPAFILLLEDDVFGIVIINAVFMLLNVSKIVYVYRILV